MNSISETKLYQKAFARDFCLPLIELWCKAESTDLRQWTNKQQPSIPYIIFERHKDTVFVYLDPQGIQWIASEIQRQRSTNPRFIEHAIEIFSQRIQPVKERWSDEPALDRQELLEFIRQLRDAWAWWEPLWWLADTIPPEDSLFTQLEAVRIATDPLGPSSDAIIRNSLRALYPELKEDSDFLLEREIREDQIPSTEELERRRRYIYTGAELYPHAERSDIETKFGIVIEGDSVPPDVRTLSGRSAYPGKASGSVRRVMGRGQVGDVKIGEIIVSSMTTVDFLPAMKKAAAIVTDEGGIICHAAIIARELKIPCIVGTKIATQVLRNGDRVEVDADTGIVRVLSRAVNDVGKGRKF